VQQEDHPDQDEDDPNGSPTSERTKNILVEALKNIVVSDQTK